MGRFLVIVIVLVGIGLAINYLAQDASNSTDQLPLTEPKQASAIATDAGPSLQAAGDAGDVAAPIASDPTDMPVAPANDTPAQSTVNTSDPPSAATTANDQPANAEASVTQIPPSEPKSTEVTGAVAESAPPETVPLGDSALARGIPGEGSLTVEQIQSWLDDAANHAILTPALPLGLAAASSQIVGLDENPLTRAKIELGRQLFFDPRLSGDHSISCASCHHPDYGYAKNTQFGEGVGGQTGNRNSPVAYNRILSGVQFWDGRASTLEEQAKGPIANPIEMSNTHDVCVNHLGDIEGYRVQFEKIFPDGVNIENVAKAIASFERTLVTGPAPWDYYSALRDFENAYAVDLEDLNLLKEDDPELYDEYMALKQAADAHPMNESAQRGAELFFGDRAGCTACHVGANFTDELYHNLGVGMDAESPDLGRFEVTKVEKDRGAFKTPTVRNIELTGPYMHDGSQQTLEEVVEWYNKGGHPNANLDEKMRPLNLTDQEKVDLVAFMKALSGPLPEVETGRFPE